MKPLTKEEQQTWSLALRGKATDAEALRMITVIDWMKRMINYKR